MIMLFYHSAPREFTHTSRQNPNRRLQNYFDALSSDLWSKSKNIKGSSPQNEVESLLVSLCKE